jgi:hypothetical protein
MLFRLAESVVNIAHVPKECLYYPPKADIGQLRLPIVMSSSATVQPSSPTGTLPPQCADGPSATGAFQQDQYPMSAVARLTD